MKCEWCKRDFEKGQVRKVVRSKPHVFCSESCFRLWRYDVPWFDLDRMYVGGSLRRAGVSVEVPPFQELISRVPVKGEPIVKGD